LHLDCERTNNANDDNKKRSQKIFELYCLFIKLIILFEVASIKFLKFRKARRVAGMARVEPVLPAFSTETRLASPVAIGTAMLPRIMHFNTSQPGHQSPARSAIHPQHQLFNSLAQEPLQPPDNEMARVGACCKASLVGLTRLVGIAFVVMAGL